MVSRLAPLCIAVLAVPLFAQSVTNDDIPFDDLKGRWMNYETSPTSLVAFVPGEDIVYAVNQPGMRVVAYDPETLEPLHEIPVGPGVVALELHPDGAELWCVDRVTSSVTVIDRIARQVIATVRVSPEPHGIVFSRNGDRAFVSCSGSDTVDVVTSDYERVSSIAVPGRKLRGIARVFDTVYVAPFQSGNGTASVGNAETGDTDDVVAIQSTAGVPGVNALPDRDLLAIAITRDPSLDYFMPAKTVTGLGTTLFNVRARPGSTELWVPHTEALNGVHAGEANFVAGQVVSNRIAIVDTVTGAAPVIVDLDELAPSLDERCGTPTSVAFTSDGSRAFIPGYGSDTVAVLDVSGTDVTWAGTIFVHQTFIYPDGAGPRDLAVSPDDRWLVLVNKGDGSITRVDLADVPQTPGFTYNAPQSELFDWDPTPPDINQGRVHFIRTQNSRSQTSSCNSCHVDGGSDGLAWDLSVYLDPEGTPNDELALGFDVKGPMMTQPLARQKEVGPFHWRGERKRLRDFDVAFTGLLERQENDETLGLEADFLYVMQYMEHLALPPNPELAIDRMYSPEQLEGAELFLTKPVQDGLACADCHALPLGTNNEIVDNKGGGTAPHTVVPHLRNLAGKLSPPFEIGGAFGTRMETGAGLQHGGAMPSIKHLLLQGLPGTSAQRFDLTEDEAAKIETFLLALDTGMPPAASFQITVGPEDAALLSGYLAFMKDQAEQGNCDLVYRYGPEVYLRAPRYMSGLYDPAAGTFRQASAGLPLLTDADLIAKAQSGTPVTLYGVPVFMGHPMALDRDNDKLLDFDEILRGTNPEKNDTDNDGFPDGYEAFWVMDPLTSDTTSPDSDAPSLLEAPKIVFATTRSVKFEFKTNEQARVLISYNGGGPVLRVPLKPKFDDEFSVVIGELEPGTDYNFRLMMEDPAGNVHDAFFDVSTANPNFGDPVHVEAIDVQVQGGATPQVYANVLLLRKDLPAIPGYNLRARLYYSSATGVELVSDVQTWLGHPSGLAHFFIPIPASLLPGGEFIFVIKGIDAPPGQPAYIRAEDTIGSASVTY